MQFKFYVYSIVDSLRKRCIIVKKDRLERNILKFLPDGLRREYEFQIKNNPDIPGLEHPLINLSDTFRAYYILVHYFTDSSSAEPSERMLVGIRSVDLLASALSRQDVSFDGKPKYREPLDICATLFFGLVKNHSFSDGNKRTALLILLYQLQMYGYVPTVSKKKFEKLVISVAANNLPKDYSLYYQKFRHYDDCAVQVISSVLKQMVSKKDNTYHTVFTAKSFCSALEDVGVKCTQENGKLHFSYKMPGKWSLFPPDEKNYSLPFGGWTRTIGAKTARTTLQTLGLYDQFASYKDFSEGADPLYELVDDFKEPLRRLKDM